MKSSKFIVLNKEILGTTLDLCNKMFCFCFIFKKDLFYFQEKSI